MDAKVIDWDSDGSSGKEKLTDSSFQESESHKSGSEVQRKGSFDSYSESDENTKKQKSISVRM